MSLQSYLLLVLLPICLQSGPFTLIWQPWTVTLCKNDCTVWLFSRYTLLNNRIGQLSHSSFGKTVIHLIWFFFFLNSLEPCVLLSCSAWNNPVHIPADNQWTMPSWTWFELRFVCVIQSHWRANYPRYCCSILLLECIAAPLTNNNSCHVKRKIQKKHVSLRVPLPSFVELLLGGSFFACMLCSACRCM